jgi:uncharacterized membrane-anchored protein YhcB (DUF1043 family)
LPENPALDALTVGSPFALHCHGDIPVEWTPGNSPKPTFPQKEQEYSLSVLQTTRLDAQDVSFVVTGYKAGKQEPDYIRFLQGEKGFEVVKPKWEIQSVVKKDEKPQPYPSFGPWSILLPMWFLVSVVLVVGLIAYLVMRALRRRAQRQRMLEDLKRHRTALSPLHQFYRDARLLRRQLHNAKSVEDLKKISEQLDREFRLYVLREFEIPTLDWTNGEILGDLKKRHRRVYRKASEPLQKTLRELFRLKGRETILLHDVEQLHRMSLDAAERLEGAKESRR